MGTIFGRASGSDSNRETKLIAMKKIFLIFCVFVGLAAIGCRSDKTSFNRLYEKICKTVPDSVVRDYFFSKDINYTNGFNEEEYIEAFLQSDVDYAYLIRCYEIGLDASFGESMSYWSYHVLSENWERQKKLLEIYKGLPASHKSFLKVLTRDMLWEYSFDYYNEKTEAERLTLSNEELARGCWEKFIEKFIWVQEDMIDIDSLKLFLLEECYCYDD